MTADYPCVSLAQHADLLFFPPLVFILFFFFKPCQSFIFFCLHFCPLALIITAAPIFSFLSLRSFTHLSCHVHLCPTFFFHPLKYNCAGVPVNSRVSSKIQQLLNTLKRPKRPPLREFFVDDFEELLDGRPMEIIIFSFIKSINHFGGRAGPWSSAFWSDRSADQRLSPLMPDFTVGRILSRPRFAAFCVHIFSFHARYLSTSYCRSDKNITVASPGLLNQQSKYTGRLGAVYFVSCQSSDHQVSQREWSPKHTATCWANPC